MDGLLVLRRVAGWVAGGCWDDEIDSYEMDHSRKFPASNAPVRVLPSIRAK